jgi:RND family efflux transporter MFP subunit
MTTGPLPVEPPGPGAERPRRLSAVTRKRLRWGLPLLVLGLGYGVTRLLVWTQERPEPRDPETTTPLVRIATAQPETIRYEVVAHGTVAPRTESDLVAEVRGRIVEVAPNFAAGAFFAADDALLRLDDREYRIAVDRGRATLELRTSEWRLALADVKRRRELSERGAVSNAELEQFESRAAVAKASRDEARASLAQARLDLERTVLRAPFEGRVRTRDVDLGQFVSPGQKVGRIYAVKDAEVRLAVPTDDLAFLDLSLGGDAQSLPETPVTLTAELGGREISWDARLVRVEGDIDLRTRMLNVVARVEDPFGRGDARAEALPAGLFVRAVIQGRQLEQVYVLPLMALRDDDRVFVVDAEGRLRVRPVQVLRRSQDSVVIGEGLDPGERLIVSPLHAYTDGMLVRPFESGRTAPSEADAP